MCKGESICCIVNQFSKGVVIEQSKSFSAFQTPGDAGHETSCIVIVVSAKPLTAEGSFQVCSGVPVRFNAADQEGTVPKGTSPEKYDFFHA